MPSRLSRFRRPLIFWGCRMLTLRLSDRSISLFIMYYPLSRALIGYISRSPELLYQTMFISRFYDALSLSKSILGNIPNLSQSSLWEAENLSELCLQLGIRLLICCQVGFPRLAPWTSIFYEFKTSCD